MAHKHDVYDVDPYFVIDADRRTISDQSDIPTSLMQYDHNSERFTFELVRHIDEHDMSLCDRIEIHYLNIGTDGKRSEGVYKVNDLVVDKEDKELVVFTWLVSQNATMHSGSLSFVIRFMCTNDDEVEYVWNTAIYNNIPVGKGMSSGEGYVAQYADVLNDWYNKFIASGVDGVSKIDTAREAALLEIEYAKDDILGRLSQEEFVQEITEVVTNTALANLDADGIANAVREMIEDDTVTTIDENSTDKQYPTAKATYTLFDTYAQEVNTLLDTIVNGEVPD